MDFQYDELQIRVSDADAVLKHAVTLTDQRIGLHCEFDFADSKWDGLGKTAVVRSGNSTQDIVIVDNAITIPSSKLVAGNNLIVGVYGTNGTTVVIPTIWCACGMVYDGTDPEHAENFEEVTKSFADQILSYMNEAIRSTIQGIALHAEQIGDVGTPTMTMQIVTDGAEKTKTHTADGISSAYSVDNDVLVVTQVKVDNVVKTIEEDYVFNTATHNVIFNEIPEANAIISIKGETHGRTIDVTVANLKGHGIENITFNTDTNILTIEEDDGTVHTIEALATAIDTMNAIAASAATAESERIIAEQDRELAESARNSSETARSSAETSRVSAEAGRVVAEASRVSAETSREAAKITTVNASVDAGTGVPSVDVSKSGNTLTLAFHNLKGQNGTGSGDMLENQYDPTSVVKSAGGIPNYVEGKGYATNTSLTNHTGNANIHVTTQDKTNWSGKYAKPGTGIPKSDLADGVQDSLDLADSALQEHQDISGKQDKSNLVTAFQSTPDNTHYPSEKLVKDALDEQSATIGDKATVADYTGTLSHSSWTGEEAPYTKAITVNGILATDKPIVDMVATGTYATDEAMQEDWAKIYRVVTSANTLTFYAKEVPAADINFVARCVR